MNSVLDNFPQQIKVMKRLKTFQTSQLDHPRYLASFIPQLFENWIVFRSQVKTTSGEILQDGPVTDNSSLKLAQHVIFLLPDFHLKT